MDFAIDMSLINNFFSLPADLMLRSLLYNFAWIPVAIVFLWGAKELWLYYIRLKWVKTVKYILLAIDIPRGNQQSPKAVENIFTYLLGAHGSLDLVEIYWTGKVQLSFSLEIVSIDGYTQFLIYTPATFRNLVESAFYSHYPDAEITEVNDYTEGAPSKFPDDEYDIFGAEFIQANNKVYPIKTYKEFEHQLGVPEEQFKDPMAAFMDLCSSLVKGEQLWFQIIIRPLGFGWISIGDKEISKILGEKTKGGENFIEKLISGIGGWLSYFSDAIFSTGVEEKKDEKKDEQFRIMNLKPKEKKQIEAIQEKVDKLSFETKLRFIYLAKKEVMNKPKVGSGFVGFMKQFATLDLNNLKPDMETTATRASYFLKESRLNSKKRRIIYNYRNRDPDAGKIPGLLNVEELATIWHFPLEAVVKAPLIQKAPGRKAEPPMTLPVGEEIASDAIFAPGTDKPDIDKIFAEEPADSGVKKNSEEQENVKKKIRVVEEEEEDIFAAALEEKEETKGAPPPNLPIA